ncbi:MAG: cysteine--tRNA ligase [Candidatus Marinimicrobia bacterium]|nr:cysteine--tRNA ligase [Candidatus Neomarinimicrobiota bacterium]
MLRFYNSLTKNKENFIPIKKGKVKLYTCGPTVYDYAHIGNFRTFLFEDFLKRTLISFGYEVFHVMNITDVDDKTINKSVKEGKKLNDIAEIYTSIFKKDLENLKILPPDVFPLATDHIDKMIEIIQILINKGHAYPTNDNSVFFSIDSFKDYGKLSNIDMSKVITGSRVSSDEYKLENPSDFVLWKAYKKEDGDVKWSSPWGDGRPGWHIECSAMSMQYLGDHFDIHCGGVDNKFPHHENEIAQSICATGKPFVNIWMHSEFLIINSDKMSKTLKNYYRLDDLLKEGLSVEEIRYIMLSAHYRSKLNFSLEKQHEAKMAIQRILELNDRLDQFVSTEEKGLPVEAENFKLALSDDLDSPKALAIFFDWLRKTNRRLDSNKLSQSDIDKGKNFIYLLDSLYSLLNKKTMVPDEILVLVKERERARKNNDWEKSDKIRIQISKDGWIIKDTPNGPKITPK